jgi:hypothetical protein
VGHTRAGACWWLRVRARCDRAGQAGLGGFSLTGSRFVLHAGVEVRGAVRGAEGAAKGEGGASPVGELIEEGDDLLLLGRHRRHFSGVQLWGQLVVGVVVADGQAALGGDRSCRGGGSGPGRGH